MQQTGRDTDRGQDGSESSATASPRPPLAPTELHPPERRPSRKDPALFNRAARRAAKQPSAPTVRPLSEAPEQLRNLAGSVQALETIHVLLQAGQFPGRFAASVLSSITFAESLLRSQRADLEAHPDFAQFFGKQS